MPQEEYKPAEKLQDVSGSDAKGTVDKAETKNNKSDTYSSKELSEIKKLLAEIEKAQDIQKNSPFDYEEGEKQEAIIKEKIAIIANSIEKIDVSKISQSADLVVIGKAGNLISQYGYKNEIIDEKYNEFGTAKRTSKAEQSDDVQEIKERDEDYTISSLVKDIEDKNNEIRNTPFNYERTEWLEGEVQKDYERIEKQLRNLNVNDVKSEEEKAAIKEACKYISDEELVKNIQKKLSSTD